MGNVLVLLADGSEELEAVTIINILRRGGVNVTAAGLHGGTLHGSRGITLTPDISLDEALMHDYDMVVLPGGQPGTENLKADARVLKLLRQMSSAGKQVAAICAAPSVLATAGLLDGKRATCYPTCLDGFPKVDLQTVAVIEDGNIITSRSPGTAMDFALTLLERLVGKAQRQEVETALVR